MHFYSVSFRLFFPTEDHHYALTIRILLDMYESCYRTRLRWLCLSVCPYVTTQSTRVSSFQPVSTRNTQLGSIRHETIGQEGRHEWSQCVCTWSLHIKSHGSEVAPKSSAGFLLAPEMRWVRAHWWGMQAGTQEQACSKTASIHPWYPARARMARAAQWHPPWREHSTYWGRNYYCQSPFDVIGTHCWNRPLWRTQFWQSAGSLVIN